MNSDFPPLGSAPPEPQVSPAASPPTFPETTATSSPLPPVTPGLADPEAARRDFLKKSACTLIGGGIVAAPLAAGITVLVDPLRRASASGDWTRITALEAVPPDGRPEKFRVVASRQDAWNRYPNVPVGFLYLRRGPGDSVTAFNASCPHAGCAVDFREDDNAFFCPCHRSHFAADGSVIQPSPAARGLDELDVELRDGAVWVRFQNFRAGIPEKRPIA